MKTKIIACILLMGLPLSSSAKMQKMPDIRSSFLLLQKNRVAYQNYNDSIFMKMNNNEWVDMMARRAAFFRREYEQNNRVIDNITRYFTQKKSRIPDAAYDSLFVNLDKAFRTTKVDNFLTDHFVSLILPHFEEKRDTATLVRLYHLAGICNTEIARFPDPDAGRLACKYFLKNLELADQFAHLPAESARVIPLDFMNYCYTLASLGFVSGKEALEKTDQFEAFIQKNESLFSKSMKKQLDAFLKQIRSSSARIHISQAKYDDTKIDITTLRRMYQASPYYKKTIADQKNLMDSVLFYQCKADIGEMSKQESDYAVKILTQNLFDEMAQKEYIDEFDIKKLNNVMTISLNLMDQNPIVLDQTRIVRTRNYCEQLVTMIQRAHITKEPFFFESMLGELASMHTIVKNLPIQDKLKFMLELAVKSQIGTVVHVSSTKAIALALFDGFMQKCPEQFLGVLGLNTMEALLANTSGLRAWLEYAALFHDIGKTGISSIINNDFHRLTPRELAISRKHPELAQKYLNVDQFFNQFKDVALGHNKWYNGKGGYPDDFDNTQSICRAFIDVVKLADCIDAATDNFNRNYRRNKELRTVLEEFRAEAGTRYNPVMVETLLGDNQLIQKIEQVANAERFKRLEEVRRKFIK